MNILYISKLSGNRWTGPNNSVPAQIAAQAQIDNVLWYNLARPSRPDWLALDYYCDLTEYSTKRLDDFSPPFNRPDLVVFQGCYSYPFTRIIFDIWNRRIPYIIIPRCEFTKDAQTQKKIKKTIANTLFFNRFIDKAEAVHFLTENERQESFPRARKNGFVIPNGVEVSDLLGGASQNDDGFHGVYIGRIDIFHKGLDLLIDACAVAASELRAHECILKLYGPDCNGSVALLKHKVRKLGIDDIVEINGPVFDDEKKKILQGAKFFIMTSRFEGHPMGLIEALAYGLPCVVTEGTNMLAEITACDAGWGASESPEAIASCIKALLVEKEDLVFYSQRARDLARRYNWVEIAQRSRDIYTQLLGK